MRVAVAGGTGTAGRRVVEHLRVRGHDTVVLARATGIDLTRESTALDDALTGVDAVIDATNLVTLGRTESTRFFGTVTGVLLRTGMRAGVGHHLALSIVGCDRVDSGYYAGKRLQESSIQESELPWTILRATQFHEFTGQLLSTVPGPVAVIPSMMSRPVAVREVAEHLVDLAAAPALNAVTEMAGPQVERQPDLARRLLRARRSRRLVLPVRMPMAGGRAMATGGLLPMGSARFGEQTFDEWLAEAKR